MAFKNNIPQPTDDLSVSQGDLLGNMQQLDTSFDIDHFTFSNLTANNGKHRKVTMPVRGAAPATIAGEGALYFKTSGSGTALYMVRDNNAGTEVQLTTASVGNVTASANGCCWLPGGLFLQWGSVASPGSSGSVNYPVPFTAIYSVQLTPRNDGSHSAFTYYLDGAPSTSAFGYRGSTSGSNTLYWMAIGSKP